jgi:hypothetical protein
MHRNEIKNWAIKTEELKTWHAWESDERILGVRRKNKRNVMHRNEIKNLAIKTEE